MKKYKVTLEKSERAELLKMIKTGKRAAKKIQRAHILLKADEGKHGEHQIDEKIKQALKVSVKTIERLRQRFVEEGLEKAISGKKKKGKPVKMTGDVEARLIALRCHMDPPEGYSKWTFRLLAQQMVELEYVESISHECVRQTLKKTR
jgi:transposase